MEDLKKIQEFFSKPLEENSKESAWKEFQKKHNVTNKTIKVARKDFEKEWEAGNLKENVDKKYSDFLVALRDSGITNMFGAAPYLQAEFGLDKREAREVLANWMRSFGESLNENAFVEAFKFEKALKGMGYDVKVKYLDDFGKDVFEIYFNNPADADESIFYDAKKLGYDNVRVFANPQESLKENALGFNDSRLSSDQHRDLDYAVRGDSAYTFGNNPYADDQLRYKYAVKMGFLEEYNSGIYYDPAKERNAPKSKEASKSGLEKVKDFIQKVMKEEEITVDDATNFKVNLKHLLDKHVVKSEALSDYEEEEANYDELYGDYKYKVDEAKPKKGHGEKISKEVFSKLKGKTINYKGADYKVIDSDEAVLKIKHLEDGDVTTINLRQFNVSGMIEEILETIELGRQLDEKKLCKKGQAYRKRRIAAGEKSSAYLSGRAVKVCKGQISGRKKRKKRRRKK